MKKLEPLWSMGHRTGVQWPSTQRKHPKNRIHRYNQLRSPGTLKPNMLEPDRVSESPIIEKRPSPQIRGSDSKSKVLKRK